MDKRCSCGTRIGRSSKTGLCASCSAKRRWADPEERRKNAERIRAIAADPVRGARMAKAGSDNFKKWHQRCKESGYTYRKAPRIKAESQVPAGRLDEYREFARRFGVKEALRLILDDEAIRLRRQGLAPAPDLSA